MKLRRWLNRALFNADEQRMFLLRLHALLKSELPVRSVFENIRRFSTAPIERKIASHSLRNISLGQPFASGYAEHGWFAPNLSALLIAGEENRCLPDTLQRALQNDSNGISAWRLIALGNLRWMVGVALAMATCVFLHLQQDLFIQVAGPPQNFAQRAVFALGSFVAHYGAAFAALALVFGFAMSFVLRSRFAWRERLDGLWLFSHYRRAFAAQLLPQMAGLMGAGLGAVDAMNALAPIHDSAYRLERLRAMRVAVASGLALDEALGRFLLQPRHAAVLQALSAAHPGRAQRALEQLEPIVLRDMEADYKTVARRLGFSCMVALLLLAYGVLEVIYAAPVNLG